MNKTYLVIALCSVLGLALLVFLYTKRKDKSSVLNRSLAGVTVSKKVLKNDRLSSDFILGAIDDGVIMVSRDDNKIHLFNEAAGTISGWQPNEAVGKDLASVLVLTDSRGQALPPESNPLIQAMVTGKTVRSSDCMLNSKGGKQVALSIVVSPLTEKAGQPAESVVGVFRDISQEKAQEAQRTEFISTASHEMRTPIAAIEGYLSLALNEKTAKIDENARNYLTKASDSTKHLGTLFADLLTSSKADDGRLSSSPAAVELGEILERVTDGETFKAKEKGLEFKFVVSSDKDVAGGKVIRPYYYTFVDPTRITEVFQNIVDNAIKYTPEGSVFVRLTGNATTAQVQVQDTGPGITPEDIPHLFQKFYRVDNSATRTIGGTGLGLYICKRIVELYNGQIWVESTWGKGSTFFINLPRLTAAQALDAQQRQSSVVSPLS